MDFRAQLLTTKAGTVMPLDQNGQIDFVPSLARRQE
jgi:hypothetical protein